MVRFITALLVGSGLIGGCGQNSQPPSREADFVLIGVDPDYPPCEYLDSLTGEIVGFDIDLITLICESNRWRYQFVATPFENLIRDLNNNDLDIAVSAITVTPEREVLVAFSDPYYLTGQVLAVPAADSVTTDLDDLRGKRVGVMTGTTGEELSKRADGVLVFPYDSIEKAISDLFVGDLDAVINDYPITRAVSSHLSGVRLVSGTLSSEYYGIAMRTDDSLRLEKLNDALAALLGGYTFERLHMKWFGYPLLDVEVPDSVARQWPTQ